MILNIFALAFVLGITFVHSMFGLYSGIVNVFCAVAALAVAFGYGEMVNDLLTGTLHLHPSYTEPCAYVLLYVITLLVLRLLTDNYLRGNVKVPMYIDWAGGAVAGFIIAQISVGVMVTGFLMLPWGGSVMMYEPIERHPEDQIDPDTGRVIFVENPLWLRSDDFAVGLFEMLSGGSLKPKTTFASVYPDFTEWVRWTGNQIQTESLTAPVRDDKVDGFRNGLNVQEIWAIEPGKAGPLVEENTRYRILAPSPERNKPPYERQAYKVQPGNKLIGARLELLTGASDRAGDYSQHRLRPTNIRIVGDLVQPDGSRTPQHYVVDVLGGADKNLGENFRIVDYDNNIQLPGGNQTVDAYFEVPENFQPRFVEYRRHARAAVPAYAEQPPTDRLTHADAGGEEGGQPTRGGQVTGQGRGVARFADAINSSMSGETDDLPFAMSRRVLGTKLDVTLREGKLQSIGMGGRLTGFRRALEPEQREERVEEILVPDNRRIFQLQTKTRQMGSLLGQAINFAASNVNQYWLVSTTGERYPMAGYYAIVKRGDDDYIEFFFSPRDPGEIGSRNMVEISNDTRQALRQQEDAVLGLIYLVPPGECFQRIEMQRGRIDFDREMCVGG